MSATRIAIALLFPLSLMPAQGGNWVQRSPTVTPSSTNYSVEMTYDSARNQTVLYKSMHRETWVYDGRTWTLMSTPQSPYRDGALCFDSVRNVVVGVFGNQSTGLETWEWNGTSA